MIVLKIIAVLVVAMPLSVFGTFMLGPLWTWLEEAHGIESVGHAMYAAWCFGATYAACVFIGLALVVALPPSRKPSPLPPVLDLDADHERET